MFQDIDMRLRSLLTAIVLLFSIEMIDAQPPKPFNPKRFEADLEQYITQRACLLPNEAAIFFPLYREMRKKQFAYLSDSRRQKFIDESDDRECAKAIRMRDANEIEAKEVQQYYHNKFLKILPAKKVLKVLEAEDEFHRNLFMGDKPRKKNHKKR